MSIAKVGKAANFLRDVPFAGARGVFLCLDHPTFSSGGRIRATRLTRALRLRVPQITIQNWSWGRRLPVVRVCVPSAHLESSYTCIDFKRLINPLLLWLLSHWRLSEYLNAKRTREWFSDAIRRELVDILRALYDRNQFITTAEWLSTSLPHRT